MEKTTTWPSLMIFSTADLADISSVVGVGANEVAREVEKAARLGAAGRWVAVRRIEAPKLL